ncbi:MAG TPA: tRNA (adenosine(37)-N6)-dimethylallyltransferase MiaA [Candidatus Eisenbacteria bacterium]|nr:tRNA (adenosine(37)-N6)-dimethylallyltransferase MiaA [Candidatus Eisenbacteria bacterium]
MTRPLPIVLLGPTAAGKSEIALHLAPLVGGEIVGADSRQIYRGLEIGTAAPSAEDRARVPHHLAAFLPPDEIYSAGRYAREARELLESFDARGVRPIVVGGSGLYIRALVGGLFTGPERDQGIRLELQARLERDGLDALREELKRVDPDSWARILPGDSVRVIRAIEVHRLTGAPISRLWREAARAPLPVRRYGIRWERPALSVRIADRIQDQLRRGFLEETRALLAQGLRPDAPGLHTLGYRELVTHLTGRTSLEEAVNTIALRTRQLAKRQETWFRKEPETRWFTVADAGEFPAIAREIARETLDAEASGETEP